MRRQEIDWSAVSTAANHLQQAAASLGALDDGIRDGVAQVERRLVELNLGLHFSVGLPQKQTDDDDDEHYVRNDLAFCKGPSGWGLYHVGGLADEEPTSSAYTPFASCRRDERQEMALLLPDLLTEAVRQIERRFAQRQEALATTMRVLELLPQSATRGLTTS